MTASQVHDMVFAEGGTLHVWLGGAKFRAMTTPLKARTVRDFSETESDMSGLDVFTPSPKLSAVMVAHADLLRDYVAQFVADLRQEFEAPPPPGVGSSGDLDDRDPARNGRGDCDCHADLSSQISRDQIHNQIHGRYLARRRRDVDGDGQ